MSTDIIFALIGFVIALFGLGITILTTGAGAVWLICTKLEKINSAIAEIRENFVKHEVCKERREKCPCVTKMEKIEKIVKLGET